MHALRAVPLFLSVLASSLFLTGCGGGSGGSSTAPPPVSTPTPAPPVATAGNSVFVNTIDAAFYPPQPSAVLQLSRTANGSASPAATITGPKSTVFGAMAVDAAGNLYVAGQIPGDPSHPGTPADLSTTEILLYPPGANGSGAPAQTVQLPGLFNNSIAGMDVDAAGNLYVSTGIEVGSGASGRVFPGVAVYSLANGTLAVSRSIVGASTGISAGGGMFGGPPIAVDGIGTVYIPGGPFGNGPQPILIFNAKASGDVAPDSMISGSSTGITNIRGMTTDRSGNLYVVSSNPMISGSTVLEFAAGATGNVAPIRTLTVASSNPDTNAGAISVDSSGNIYVWGVTPAFTPGVLVYPPSATGAAAPSATITFGPNYVQTGWGLAVQK